MWSSSMPDAQSTAVSHRSQLSLFAWLLAMLLPAAMAALSAGCGFHLRGSAALPPAMAVTFIKSNNPFSSLVDDFSAALQVHDVRVTKERSEATAVLNILDSSIKTAVLSVNTAGKVLEYDIQQTIRFSVVTAGNKPLVQEQTVSLSRDYVYSSTGTLGKERERKVVLTNLQRNIVNLAMLRITAAAR